jgi:short-subunit dehydrogenase
VTSGSAGPRLGRGARAIITGASFGLGAAFAEALAQRGVDVLLVARTDTRLLPMAADLAAAHDVRAEIATLDLVAPDGPRRLRAHADGLGFEPDVLVNAAGIDAGGRFAEQPLELVLDMVRLNVEALVALIHLYLPRMAARRSGAIVNVASAAAFGPLPGHAVYAASEAFVLSLSEALWAEQRRNGVGVVAVCPGASSGGRDVGAGGPLGLGAPASREAIVASALAAVERDVPVVVPGTGTRAASILLGLLAPRARVRLAARLSRAYPGLLLGGRRRER